MKRGIFLWSICVLLLSSLFISCTEKFSDVKPVNGLLTEAIGAGEAPQSVKDVMQTPEVDGRYEAILGDKESELSVWSLMHCSQTLSSESYGVLISRANGQTITAFPDIRHGNMPTAIYDAEADALWLTGADMEGTGVRVEHLYQLRFVDSGKATVVRSIDPYDVQQLFCQQLSYKVDGNKVTLFLNGEQLKTVTCTTENMYGISEDAVWIGEQLSYDLSDEGISVCISPAIRYMIKGDGEKAGEAVMLYDDMPDIIATVMVTDEGISLSDIRIKEASNE